MMVASISFLFPVLLLLGALLMPENSVPKSFGKFLETVFIICVPFFGVSNITCYVTMCRLAELAGKSRHIWALLGLFGLIAPFIGHLPTKQIAQEQGWL